MIGNVYISFQYIRLLPDNIDKTGGDFQAKRRIFTKITLRICTYEVFARRTIGNVSIIIANILSRVKH
jgi:hypothetical protein